MLRKCATNLSQWLNGKRHVMPFAVPIVWEEPSNHTTDCYFCMVPPVSVGITKKEKWTIVYPNVCSLSSSVRRRSFRSRTSKEFTIDSDDEDVGESTSVSPEPPASIEPHVSHGRSSAPDTHSHTGRTERSCSRSRAVQEQSRVTGIKS